MSRMQSLNALGNKLLTNCSVNRSENPPTIKLHLNLLLKENNYSAISVS